MAEEKGKRRTVIEPKAQSNQPPPPVERKIVAPGFRWVTKGEKGRGVEPGIQTNEKSK